jgi:multidrug efflux pump subunit AcrA (membrane-fusion protein)
MNFAGRLLPLAVLVGTVTPATARGQALPTSARVDTEPLTLTPPERFQVPCHLEPIRRVTLVAPADGVVRSQGAKAGASVRPGQEVAQLDNSEAAAHLKIAQAQVKEQQAALEETTAVNQRTSPSTQAAVARAQARVEAAQGRAELARIAFDRCSIRAPFAGRLLASPVSDGQFVTRGTVLAELADVTDLRVLVPIRRGGAAVGGSVTLSVDGQAITGKVQALLPLPESMAAVRALASPMAAAWVVVPNTDATLEPGQRVVPLVLPEAPVAVIAAHALQKKADPAAAGEAPTVQVVRDDHVTNLKVRVLGNLGTDRVQVSGTFRPTDALIVSTNVPLLAGTLIRFHGAGAGAGAETGTAPADDEEPAVQPAPRATPGRNAPRPKTTPRPRTTPPAPAGRTTPVPF